MLDLCWAFCAVALIVLYKVTDWWLHSGRSLPSASVRCVVITGCDSGFGRLLAERLSAKGWTVVAACLTEEAATELRESTGAISVRMDVRDGEAVESTAAVVEKELQQRGITGVWGLVNNAGIAGSKSGPTCFLTGEDFKEVLSVNLIGIQNVTRAFLPQVLRARGRIVNTSSILGRLAVPGAAAYSASKFGVQALSDCYRRELLPFGVRVACVEPGSFRTDIANTEALARTVRVSFEEAPAALRDYFTDEIMRFNISIFAKAALSSRLSDVVDAYEAALTDPRPRARYMIGKDAKFILWPLSLLPEWLSDSLLAYPTPRPTAHS